MLERKSGQLFETAPAPLVSEGNPLLDDRPLNANTSNQTIPIYRRKARTDRDLRFLVRKETAADAIAGFMHGDSILGLTKGQFSLIDLLNATLDKTGPAKMVLSTWTAAGQDVTDILDFCDAGRVLAARFLVDLTFQRRTPALAHRIRKTFGRDAIRVANNHAKFALLASPRWKVVIRTSMNLNFNPRNEDFEIEENPQLYDFLLGTVDQLWARQEASLADQTPAQIRATWQQNLADSAASLDARRGAR